MNEPGVCLTGRGKPHSRYGRFRKIGQSRKSPDVLTIFRHGILFKYELRRLFLPSPLHIF